MIPELQRADLPLQPRMDERQEERAAKGRTGGGVPQRRQRRQLRGPPAAVAAAAATGAGRHGGRTESRRCELSSEYQIRGLSLST